MSLATYHVTRDTGITTEGGHARVECIKCNKRYTMCDEWCGADTCFQLSGGLNISNCQNYDLAPIMTETPTCQ